MAKGGLSSFLHAKLNTDGTYGEVEKLAGAISYKETLTKNAYKQYADNQLAFEDTSVTGGSVALEVLDDNPVIFAPLLGQGTKKVKVGTEEKEVFVGNSDDVSIPVGFGFIENVRDTEGLKYQVKFYPKITFAPYDKENSTKKESTEYKNPTVTGTIYNIDNGDYAYEQRFATMLEALKVLYALFGKELPVELEEKFKQDAEDSTTEETENMGV